MYAAIVFLPLIGALIAGFGGRFIGDRGAQVATCGAMLLAALLSVVAFFDIALGGNPQTILLSDWIRSGTFEASWALRFDTLTAVWLFVVTGVSAAVLVCSIGYMCHDPDVPRFVAHLSLFTFSMLMLVTADYLVEM